MQRPQSGTRPPATGAVRTPLPRRGAVVPARLPPFALPLLFAGGGAEPNPDGSGSNTGGGAAAAATAEDRALFRFSKGAGGGNVCLAGILVRGGRGEVGRGKFTGAGGGKVCLAGIFVRGGRGEVGRAKFTGAGGGKVCLTGIVSNGGRGEMGRRGAATAATGGLGS